MTALRTVFIGQLLLLLPAWVAFATQPAGLGTLYLIVWVAVLGFAVAIFAVWQAMRHTGAWPLALLSIVATLVIVATPFVIDALDLPLVPLPVVIAAGVVMTILAAGVLLSKRKRWQPGTLFSGRKFNTRILISIAVAIALIWVPIVVWLAAGYGAELGESTSKDNATRAAFMVYYASLSLPASVLVSFSLLFAAVGMLRSSGSRLIHAGQLAGSLVLLISLGFVAGGIALGMVNPG